MKQGAFYLLFVYVVSKSAAAFASSSRNLATPANDRRRRGPPTTTAANLPSNHEYQQPPMTTSRTLVVVQSAKVLPIAYTFTSGAVLFRALSSIFFHPPPPAAAALAAKTIRSIEQGALLSTACFILFTLLPTDTQYFVASKRAILRSQEENDPSLMEAATKFRFAVRRKLIGQVLGFVSMIFTVLRTPSLDSSTPFRLPTFFVSCFIMMVSNVLFFTFWGGDTYMHNTDGTFTPLENSDSLSRLIAYTLFAATSLMNAYFVPLSSPSYKTLAGIYCGGVGTMAFNSCMDWIQTKKERN